MKNLTGQQNVTFTHSARLTLIVKIAVLFRELKVKCVGFVGICNHISFNNAQVILHSCRAITSSSSLLILVSYTNSLVPAEGSFPFAYKALTSWNIGSFYAEDTHLTCTVPAVLRLHPQLLIPIDQAVGAASPLAVTALKLGQPRLGIVQLRTSTQSSASAN